MEQNAWPGLSKKGEIVTGKLLSKPDPSDPVELATPSTSSPDLGKEMRMGCRACLFISFQSQDQAAEKAVEEIIRHLTKIYSKIGVGSRTEAIRYALKQGLL